MNSLNGRLSESLKNYFGFDAFRTGQQNAIEKLLNNQSVLAIFPTGSGKSLCYQFTALHLPGLTLVVSPLLALIKDQVDFLRSKGISAASLDSSLSKEEYADVVEQVKTGSLKILMVSVERFKNERFRQLLEQVPISLLVVDEAHCISEWGHNFRPDYLKLPSYRQELNIAQVLLLTATATDKVKQDMCAKFDIAVENVVQTGFYRANLDLAVHAVSAANKHEQLLSLVSRPGCGIVYVTLQDTSHRVADFLIAQGINAIAYHAGLASDERTRIQMAFMNGQYNVIVATIAFGMGIDKADIRFVVHYDLPKSIENYSQEIGRAGRDGLSSHCSVLGHLDELTTLENFVYGDTPELASIKRFLDIVAQNNQNGRWDCKLYSLSQACNIRQLTLKTLLVQCELRGILQAKYSYFAEYRYYFVQDEASLLARFDATRQAFLQQLFAVTNFKKKWGSIDIQQFCSSTNESRERVINALDYLHQQGLIFLETKQMVDVYGVSSAKLTEPNLATELAQYFKHTEDSEINRINAMVQFFQQAPCYTHYLARYFGDDKAPVQCGHCSACRTGPVTLDYIYPTSNINNNQLVSAIDELTQAFVSNEIVLSDILIARFLCGLTQPVFTQLKLTRKPNYGCFKTHRFSCVLSLVAQLREQDNTNSTN